MKKLLFFIFTTLASFFVAFSSLPVSAVSDISYCTNVNNSYTASDMYNIASTNSADIFTDPDIAWIIVNSPSYSIDPDSYILLATNYGSQGYSPIQFGTADNYPYVAAYSYGASKHIRYDFNDDNTYTTLADFSNMYFWLNTSSQYTPTCLLAYGGNADFLNHSSDGVSPWAIDIPPPYTGSTTLEMDMRSDFSIVGQYDNFTATYLKTTMCEFGINNNCNPSDMPSPLALRWRLINDDLTVSPFSYGDMNDANTVCTVVTAYNDPFTSASCVNLYPENASKWSKDAHYTLYLQPFIQQSVLDTLPQYNITMRYTGQAFDTSLANYSNDTSNNTISEDGTFTSPPSVSPYPNCGSLYPVAWNSFDNFFPAIGCNVSNWASMLFIPTSAQLNAVFTSTTFNTHGLTAIITAPLTLVNELSSATCSSLSIPLPFVGQDLTLPCMTTIYEDNFGAIFTIYQTITTGIICYWVIVKFLHKIKNFQEPDQDKIEVLDL